MAIAQRIKLEIKVPTTQRLKYMPFASDYLCLIAKRPKMTSSYIVATIYAICRLKHEFLTVLYVPLADASSK